VRVLFDQGTPAPLRHTLLGHSVSTAFEMGWHTLSNGALIVEADKAFDVLITTDRNLRHQQNFTGLRLAIIALPTTSWPRIRRHIAAIVTALGAIRPGEYVEVMFST
jgi:hypothetical protein